MVRLRSPLLAALAAAFLLAGCFSATPAKDTREAARPAGDGSYVAEGSVHMGGALNVTKRFSIPLPAGFSHLRTEVSYSFTAGLRYCWGEEQGTPNLCQADPQGTAGHAAPDQTASFNPGTVDRLVWFTLDLHSDGSFRFVFHPVP